MHTGFFGYTRAARTVEVPPINIILPSSLASTRRGLTSLLACFGNAGGDVGSNAATDSTSDGQGHSARSTMNLQALAEPVVELWHTCGLTTAVSQGQFNGQQSADYAYLQACVEVLDPSQIRELTQQLYRELLSLSDNIGKSRFVRIWNYIPQITLGDSDNECYRQFCWGRADALADVDLPAATGIGSRDGWLRIGALCTVPESTDPESTSKEGIRVSHLENPRQVSAYHYPRDYGPRSPSFARATLLEPPPATAASGLLLLSGTASIVNHETRHSGDLRRQSEETAVNINALLDTLERPATPMAMRYYLRDPNRLQEAKDYWKQHFPSWSMPAFYAADICREELELEVEGVFRV